MGQIVLPKMGQIAFLKMATVLAGVSAVLFVIPSVVFGPQFRRDHPRSVSAFQDPPAPGNIRVVFTTEDGLGIRHLDVLDESTKTMICSNVNNWVDIPRTWQRIRLQVSRKDVGLVFTVDQSKRVQVFEVAKSRLP